MIMCYIPFSDVIFVNRVSCRRDRHYPIIFEQACKEIDMGIIRNEISNPLKSIDESEVNRLDKELSEIDGDVIRYFKKPAETPVPNFERLIAQIRALPESKQFPKVLSLKISNLKYKAHYYDRSWRQIRENVVEASMRKKEFERRKETYWSARTVSSKGKIQKKGVKVKGVLFQAQQRKMREHEVPSENSAVESKQAFRNRIVKQFKTLQQEGQSEKKLALVWNKEKQRCDLIVDKRQPTEK
jgi:hypothetical protein